VVGYIEDVGGRDPPDLSKLEEQGPGLARPARIPRASNGPDTRPARAARVRQERCVLSTPSLSSHNCHTVERCVMSEKCHESTLTLAERGRASRRRRPKKSARTRVRRPSPEKVEVYAKPELRYTKIRQDKSLGTTPTYDRHEFAASREVREIRERGARRGAVHVVHTGSGGDGKGSYLPVASGPAPGPVARNMREAIALEEQRQLRRAMMKALVED
jgi:hypothetical protein